MLATRAAACDRSDGGTASNRDDGVNVGDGDDRTLRMSPLSE